MATPTKIHRKGQDIAFAEDGNQGNQSLLIRDRLIGSGHKDFSTAGDGPRWGVVGEPITISRGVRGGTSAAEQVTVTEHFRQGNPWAGRHVLDYHVVTAIPSTGIPLFVVPNTNKTYRIVEVRESHNVAETTAATLNAIIERCQGTEAANAGNELVGNEAGRRVNVKGTANTVLEQDADAGGFVTLESLNGKILGPGDRVVLHFEVDAGTATATTEYDGCITFIVEPVAEKETNEVIKTVAINTAIPTTGVTVFHAVDGRYQVTNIEEVHTVAETTAATLNVKVERCQGVEAAAAGDDLLGATAIDAKAAADTAQVGTLVTTGNRDILNQGDRLVLHFALDNETANASTEFVGQVTIRLVPLVEPVTEETIISPSFHNAVAATGIPIFQAIGKRYRVTHISEVHTVAESTAATCNMKIERCQGIEAALAGDDLVGATAINVKAAANTVINVTPTTTSDIHILEDGDRLVLHFAVDAETAQATTEYDGTVTIRLEPIPADGPLRFGELFTAQGKSYKVTSVQAKWGRAEVFQSECNLKVERLQGTEFAGGGDSLIGATDIDFTGAINTVATGTVVSGGTEILAAGDRLAVFAADDGGFQVAPSQLDDVQVTAKLVAQADAGDPIDDGVLFVNKTGRPVELVSATAAWDAPEVTATTLNLNLERLTVNEAAGAANGDLLNGLTDINVKGTDDTADSAVLVATSSIRATVQSVGSGLSDATAGGTVAMPTGKKRVVFTLVVSETGATDKFDIKRDVGEGDVVIATKVSMTGAAQNLKDGVTVTWAATTGHTLNNEFQIIASNDTILEDGDRLGYYFDVDAGGTPTVPTELNGLNVTVQLVPTQLAEAST